MTLPPLRRENLTERRSEAWQPPPFSSPTRWGRVLAAGRRLLDLQAASIWRDLRVLLPACTGVVLDVGCGAQPYRPLLPASVKYTAIDTVDARERFGYSIPDTLYFAGSTWPIDSGSCDLVLATETLEHVSRPAEFLAEARRCLKPDGCLLLTVPFAARWHYIPYDYWRFTPSGLAQLLTEAGFAAPQVYGRGNAITVAAYKGITVILTLLLSKPPSLFALCCSRIAGLALAPALLPMAVAAHWSMRGSGEDCLGYTVVTTPSAPPSPGLAERVSITAEMVQEHAQ